MKPYYEDSCSILYCGDSLLDNYLLEKIDCIITDPPYGVNYKSGNRRMIGSFDLITNDDGNLDIDKIISKYLEFMSDGNHIYCFGVNLNVEKLVHETELIWDKGQVGMGNLSLPWGPQFEKIWFYVYVPSGYARKRGDYKLTAKKRKGNVLMVTKVSGSSLRHPTEKPIELLRILIESSTNIGDTIFDPFAGSGSTLVAAKMEGRRSIGIEIEEKYCSIAAERLGKISIWSGIE